jgi:hypothetical protein
MSETSTNTPKNNAANGTVPTNNAPKNNTRKNKNNAAKNNAPKNNVNKNNAPKNNVNKNNAPKNNTPKNNVNKNNAAANTAAEPVAPADDTGKLDENIEKITPLLKKVQELQVSYKDAKEEDKPAIDTEFQGVKSQVLELQSTITEELENTDLKKNVLTHLEEKYPEYHQIISDLGILNNKEEAPPTEAPPTEAPPTEAAATEEAPVPAVEEVAPVVNKVNNNTSKNNNQIGGRKARKGRKTRRRRHH